MAMEVSHSSCLWVRDRVPVIHGHGLVDRLFVRSSMAFGRRIQEVNLLGGFILPVWGIIEEALSKQDLIQSNHLKLFGVRLNR